VLADETINENQRIYLASVLKNIFRPFPQYDQEHHKPVEFSYTERVRKAKVFRRLNKLADIFTGTPAM